MITSPYNLDGFINNFINGNKTTIITKILCRNDKELILVNIHLPAYLKNEEERIKTLMYLFDYCHNQYSQGNYVVIGGDFNMNIKTDNIDSKLLEGLIEIINNENWSIIISDTSTHKSGCIIDYFLISPNLRGESTSFDEFSYSDHSPVVLTLNKI